MVACQQWFETQGRASRAHILREEETHLAVGREREPVPDVVGDLIQQPRVSMLDLASRTHTQLNHTCRDSGCDGIENVATEAQPARAAAPDDGQDLGEFEDGASCDHSESEHFREGEFEAFGRGQVEVVHEGRVAFLSGLVSALPDGAGVTAVAAHLTDECDCWLGHDGWQVVRDGLQRLQLMRDERGHLRSGREAGSRQAAGVTRDCATLCQSWTRLEQLGVQDQKDKLLLDSPT